MKNCLSIAVTHAKGKPVVKNLFSTSSH